MSNRRSTIERQTRETKISLELNIDGTGSTNIDTGIPFFDHMLELFGRHGLLDLSVIAQGDLQVDAHHTVEDIGLCLGQALEEALGSKSGIVRYGSALLPMDETLVMVVVDISGRPLLKYDVVLPVETIGTYDSALTAEFLQAFVSRGGLTLHVRQMSGENAHHIIEAVFKGLGRALDQATKIDPRVSGAPSTKGTL